VQTNASAYPLTTKCTVFNALALFCVVSYSVNRLFDMTLSLANSFKVDAFVFALVILFGLAAMYLF